MHISLALYWDLLELTTGVVAHAAACQFVLPELYELLVARRKRFIPKP